MKKILATLITALSLMTLLPLANADVIDLYNDNTTGSGVVKDVSANEFKTWSCDVSVSDTTVSAVEVRIDGNQCTAAKCGTAALNKFSPTPMALYSMAPAELAAGIGSFAIVDIPVQRIRASLVTLTGGTNPYVAVRCTGVK
ncbi:MAG: hypothetical protein HQL01_11510 [Nitrospirae bacterium]|nr:hypothetical protein [Nitrospirota bacterium]